MRLVPRTTVNEFDLRHSFLPYNTYGSTKFSGLVFLCFRLKCSKQYGMSYEKGFAQKICRTDEVVYFLAK